MPGLICALLLATATVWDDRPAENLNGWFPLGNGEIGCLVDGGVENLTIRFTTDAFQGDGIRPVPWSGWNFGLLTIRLDGALDSAAGYDRGLLKAGEAALRVKGLSGYRRELRLDEGLYRDSFTLDGIRYERTVFVAPRPDMIRIKIKTDRPAKYDVTLEGCHGEPVETISQLNLQTFSGELPAGLRYVAQSAVLNNGWAPSGFDVVVRLGTARKKAVKMLPTFPGWGEAMSRHQSDYSRLWDRCSLALDGVDHPSEPTRVRIEKARKGAPDPKLDALLFALGRYLLIASSRPGTPGFESQWTAADFVNLPDCFEPFAAGFCRKIQDEKRHPEAVLRSCKLYEHYLFNGNRKYLKEMAWPALEAMGEMILACPSRGKPLPEEDRVRALLSVILRADRVCGANAGFTEAIRSLRETLPVPTWTDRAQPTTMPYRLYGDRTDLCKTARALLASDERTADGKLLFRLLPHLPEAWRAGGRVTGLKAFGDYTVDFAWKNGKVKEKRIYGGDPSRVEIVEE